MQNFKQTTLDLNGPVISFTQNPENISVVTGLAVTFVGIVTATFPTQTPANPASNTGSISYQWYESGVGALSNTTTITGTATTTLTLNPVTSPTDNKRQFYLTADYIPSAYGTSPITAGTGRSTGNAINDPISSTIATLTVIPSLSIISQPVAVTDASSENFTTFNITALVSDVSLSGGLTYQWRLNGSNLGNDGDTIGSNSSTLQIRRTAGTYTIDCIVSHPDTIPLTVTSSSVNYTTELPRALLVVERIDTSDQSRPTLIASEQFDLKTQTANLIGLSGDLYFNRGSFDPQRGAAPPGISYSIYSPEKDITVRIEIAGASGESRNSVQAGQGGYGVFKITLKKNVEYTLKLGSFNGFFGPTGGTLTGTIEGGVGGGGAFFYRGTRLIFVAGGGGGSGTQAAGGDGSGPGSSRAENGFGRNGGKGGDGGPSNDPNETVDSFLYDIFLLLETTKGKYAIRTNYSKYQDTTLSYSFKKKLGSKRIAGMKAKKLIVTFTDIDKKFSFYYFKHIPANYGSAYTNFPGLVVEYYLPTDEGMYQYTLTEFKRIDPPLTLFMVPTDYKRVSIEEFMEEMSKP